MAHARVLQQGQAVGDPLVLAADGVGIVAAGDADAQGVSQPAAGGEQVGGAVVHLGVPLVPQDVAAFAVEEDQALGQDVDGVVQPAFGPPRLALGPRQGVLVPAAQERRERSCDSGHGRTDPGHPGPPGFRRKHTHGEASPLERAREEPYAG